MVSIFQKIREIAGIIGMNSPKLRPDGVSSSSRISPSCPIIRSSAAGAWPRSLEM
ncbi:MAG: hypothetical protein NWE89_11265 [Candidatus Bathyarchaeota archaeon]|nr:hypothetical protein [Candidatus Bathyarchaeota archaeon]